MTNRGRVPALAQAPSAPAARGRRSHQVPAGEHEPAGAGPEPALSTRPTPSSHPKATGHPKATSHPKATERRRPRGPRRPESGQGALWRSPPWAPDAPRGTKIPEKHALRRPKLPRERGGMADSRGPEESSTTRHPRRGTHRRHAPSDRQSLPRPAPPHPEGHIGEDQGGIRRKPCGPVPSSRGGLRLSHPERRLWLCPPVVRRREDGSRPLNSVRPEGRTPNPKEGRPARRTSADPRRRNRPRGQETSSAPRKTGPRSQTRRPDASTQTTRDWLR